MRRYILTGYIAKGTTLWNKEIMGFLSVSDVMWVMNIKMVYQHQTVIISYILVSCKEQATY